MKNISFNVNLQADFKRLTREPILILLFLAPLLALTVIKVVLTFGVPLLYQNTGFDLKPWYGYVLATTLLIAPSMLGCVSGFIMIDDRDERMTDLMSITPMGFEGYLFIRLLMPFLSSVLYSLLGYFLLDIYSLDGVRLLLLCVMTGFESIIVGLALFILADNKVKGLTCAKGLGALMITALSDILHLPWLSVLSSLIPFCWVSRLVVQPLSLMNVMGLLVTHALWMGLALHKIKRTPSQ